MRLSKEQLIQKIKQVLKQVGTSQMSQSAYDLGWLLRLPAGRHSLSDPKNYEKPRYPQIISWLEKLQHKDGSWGGQIPFAHDRVISTLSVIAGLSHWPLNEKWRGRIAKAAKAVELYSKKLLKESEATVAFELLFPKLLREVKNSGRTVNIPSKILKHYQNLQKQKLDKLPIAAAMKYPTTLLHALEALDENKIDLRKFEKFQSPGGSFGCSPASTAFMLLNNIGGKKAERYLDVLVEKGAVPVLWPMEIFEINWCLFPFFFFGISNQFSELMKSRLAHLKRWWTKRGIGLSKEFFAPDIDDTLTAFYLLQKSGIKLNQTVFEHFETKDGFVCYPGERAGSASHYADLFFAFETCSLDSRIERMKKKVLTFLLKTQTRDGFWNDKWNISPHYATARVVLALMNEKSAKAAVSKAIHWILQSQHSNGLWGFKNGTAEESAFALSALLLYNKKNDTAQQALRRGIKALSDRFGYFNYQELWIGKSLYAPTAIAELAIWPVLFAYLYEKSDEK